ncbi:MAG: iron donor protein CyaY [Myxococcota bacterium]|nr:iron donor protein CyaY [Myxococcota bacterium]
MTEAEFRRLVSEVLDQLFDQIDLLETDDIDPRLSAGVLKVDFEEGGTFVLSQQVPVQELWLSANATAWHFKIVDDQWVERDSQEPMLPLLSKLFTDKLQISVSLELD